MSQTRTINSRAQIQDFLDIKDLPNKHQLELARKHLINVWEQLHIPTACIARLIKNMPPQEYPEVWVALANIKWQTINKLDDVFLNQIKKLNFEDASEVENLLNSLNDELHQLSNKRMRQSIINLKEFARENEIIKLIQLIIIFIPDVNKPCHLLLEKNQSPHPYSPIFLAIYFGFLRENKLMQKQRALSIIPVLLIRGADPNGLAQDETILTKIIKSPLGDSKTGIKLIKLLVQYHLDISTHQFEILTLCIKHHRHALLKYLLNAIETMSQSHQLKEKPLLLHDAMTTNDHKSIQILLNHGVLNELTANQPFISAPEFSLSFAEIIKMGHAQIVAYTLDLCLFQLNNEDLFEYLENEIPSLFSDHPCQQLKELLQAFRPLTIYSHERSFRTYFRQENYRLFSQYLYEQLVEYTLEHFIKGEFNHEKSNQQFFKNLIKLVNKFDGDDRLMTIFKHITQKIKAIAEQSLRYNYGGKVG